MVQAISRQIAELLLGVWHCHRTQEFLGYVETTFGERIAEPAEFEDIHLHETAEGDVERGLLMNATTTQWWVIDHNGLRETLRPSGW